MNDCSLISRRGFFGTVAAGAALIPLVGWRDVADAIEVAELPVGSAPTPLESAWFPSRLHAFVWRNWSLVSPQRIAEVVGATVEDIREVGRSMGLAPSRGLTDEQRRRAHLTVIRRNWHLLPYAQILQILGWTPDRMAYTLREDDYFFHKLGQAKPKVDALRWSPPTDAEKARAAEIASLARELFPEGSLEGREPLFTFVDELKRMPDSVVKVRSIDEGAPLRMGYSYFALCGDPLLDPSLDPYPEGLLARLAAVGVNAVWLHTELRQLAPLPWSNDTQVEERRKTLRELTRRAGKYGMKIFLYFNEPRALLAESPVFAQHPDWRGVLEKGYHALCTSAPEVRAALTAGVESLCRAVPDLGGFFTITASENLTNCWSHGHGDGCPRCKERKPAEVLVEVSGVFAQGVQAAGGRQRYIAWDWGWRDDWTPEIIERLPAAVELQSVSEWLLPIERGGVKSLVGEYSISAVGPGPRALGNWAAAKKRGLHVSAKVQCGNTWECSAVPFLPVLENITRHASGLREAGVTDIMLGWTLGGYPSPNIEAYREIEAGGTLETLAAKRHGKAQAAAAADFWRECSAAFREFPFHIGVVYDAPLQMGPANPLWREATHYHACMVGIPYDDLKLWRSVYTPEVFAAQLEKVAAGFEAAVAKAKQAVAAPAAPLAEELRFAEAAAIHFASVANQSRFVMARDAGDQNEMRRLAAAEAALAVRLHGLQAIDSRIGYEASNQYYYVPLDLVEKAVNCRWIAAR